MKKIYLLILCALLGTSCEDFLKESSSDQIIPRSVVDYSEFVYGEVYYKMYYENPIHTWLDIMTDDCEDFAKRAALGVDTRIDGFGYYAWQQDPEIPTDASARNDDLSWEVYYHQILISNIVLRDIDEATGTQEAKDALRGECHMIRAYAYYMLVNLYGEPYDPATAATAAGVPVNNLVGVANEQFARASVAEIYRIIDNDLRDGIRFLEAGDGKNTIYRWNLAAACVFASRVALYMQNWDDAVSWADAALALNSKLWNLEDKNTNNLSAYFLCKDNPEILYTYGDYNITYFATLAKGVFPTSADLKSLYVTGDLRYGANNGHFIRNQGSTFIGGGKRYVQYKYYNRDETLVFGSAIRTAEALLNRAEAYSHRPADLQKAIDDLNTLRHERFTTAAYKLLTLTDQADVIQKVRDERRRELCFEKHRWFDLRRWGRPQIVHKFTPVLGDASTTVTYVLEENDPAYTLPIPRKVMDRDLDIKNIVRPERNPVN
jgi:hypothetical protein